MDRFLKDSELYEIYRMGNKDVIVFESHNLALPIWGAVSSASNVPLNLISFDYHTDTHPPFISEFCSKTSGAVREYSEKHAVIRHILNGKKYNRKSFLFDDVLEIANEHLRNDEHILTAEYFGFIKSYTIICDLDSDEAKLYEEQDKINGYDAKYCSKYELEKLEMPNLVEIILDFDLDYFNKKSDFNDSFIKLVSPLILEAEVITIAKESMFFDLCKKDDSFQVEDAFEMLMELIKTTLVNY